MAKAPDLEVDVSVRVRGDSLLAEQALRVQQLRDEAQDEDAYFEAADQLAAMVLEATSAQASVAPKRFQGQLPDAPKLPNPPKSSPTVLCDGEGKPIKRERA